MSSDTIMLLIALVTYLGLAIAIIVVVHKGHQSAQERDQRDGTLDQGSAHTDAQNVAQRRGGAAWHG